MSIGKIVAVDLFNYQFGLKKVTNYISERVERVRFNQFLSIVSSRKAKVYLASYTVLYVVGGIIGMATLDFNSNYMLDTTNLYMIAVLVFIMVGF